MTWWCGLLLLLVACSGSGGPLPEELAAPRCDGPVVTPGAGRIAWTLSGADERASVDADPISMGDGFLIGLGRCISFLEVDGRLRWSHPGSMVDAVRVGDVIVVALSPTQVTVLGLDAGSGAVRWESRDRAIWHDVVALGDTVMVVGTSFDGSVATFDAATGRRISGVFGGTERPGWFFRAVAQDGLLVASGTGERRGALVVADASGTISLAMPAGLYSPEPVGVAGGVIVLQSNGSTSGAGDGEPSTQFVGLERATGKERWRRVVPGERAGHAVEAAGVVAARVRDGLVGVDARSGAIRWMFSLPGDYESPLLVVDRETVAVGAQDGSVRIVTAGDGTVRWSVDVGGAVARLGTVADGVLLVASEPGDYQALSMSDGRALWSQRGPDPGLGSSPPHHEQVVAVAGGTAMTVVGLYQLAAIRVAP